MKRPRRYLCLDGPLNGQYATMREAFGADYNVFYRPEAEERWAALGETDVLTHPVAA